LAEVLLGLNLVLNVVLGEVAGDLRRIRQGIQVGRAARATPEQSSFRASDEDAAAIFCKANLAAGSDRRAAYLIYRRESIFHLVSLLPACSTTSRQFHIAQAVRRACSACVKVQKSCQSPGRNFLSSLPTIQAPGGEKMGRTNGLISMRRPRAFFLKPIASLKRSTSGRSRKDSSPWETFRMPGLAKAFCITLKVSA